MMLLVRTRFGIWLTMLLHRHGDALLRVKGILNVADAAAPVTVHAVQHLGIPRTILARGPTRNGPRV
jgi:G3E family GTPase